MDGPTRDERIVLIMAAEAENERFVTLPAENGQWEIHDIVEGKTYVLGGSIQRAICECVAQILNQTITNNNE